MCPEGSLWDRGIQKGCSCHCYSIQVLYENSGACSSVPTKAGISEGEMEGSQHLTAVLGNSRIKDFSITIS